MRGTVAGPNPPGSAYAGARWLRRAPRTRDAKLGTRPRHRGIRRAQCSSRPERSSGLPHAEAVRPRPTGAPGQRAWRPSHCPLPSSTSPRWDLACASPSARLVAVIARTLETLGSNSPGRFPSTSTRAALSGRLVEFLPIQSPWDEPPRRVSVRESFFVSSLFAFRSRGRRVSG